MNNDGDLHLAAAEADLEADAQYACGLWSPEHGIAPAAGECDTDADGDPVDEGLPLTAAITEIWT